jgi:hypothetical protein
MNTYYDILRVYLYSFLGLNSHENDWFLHFHFTVKRHKIEKYYSKWTSQSIQILGIPPAEYSTAMIWLSNLTLTLQKTQTALYSTRRHILWQMDLLPATKNVTLRRPRPRPSGPRTQTLFSAWNIPYSRGIHPPKRPPRYQGRCDLAPRRAPLGQTVLGYRATHSVSPPHCRPATTTSSHRKRAPTRFQRGRNKAKLKIRRIAWMLYV